MTKCPKCGTEVEDETSKSNLVISSHMGLFIFIALAISALFSDGLLLSGFLFFTMLYFSYLMAYDLGWVKGRFVIFKKTKR